MSSLTHEQVVQYIQDLDISLENRNLPADEDVPECTDADLEAIALIAEEVELLRIPRRTAAVDARGLQVFLSSITPEMRDDVLNSTLLAQLAANKAAGGGPEIDPDTWYSKYTEVLSNVGWTLQAFHSAQIENPTQYRNAAALIVKLAASQLAPAERAALKYTIASLARRNNRRPHRLLNDSSISNNSTGFYVGVVSASQGNPSFKIMYNTYSASSPVTSVLFFKWAGQSISFTTGNQTMVLNTEVYANVRERVRDMIEHAGIRGGVPIDDVHLD